MPAKELLTAICDDDGEIIKTIFYDNVRDFQGFNKVNSGIRRSIEPPGSRDKFLLLNNGITVVAKSVNKIGSAFKISDFQIVNGCQTSHVLHHLRDLIDDKVFVPLKLIITDNDDVTNDIIRATNSQTEVKNEAFEILKPFHKKLEEFYLSFEKEENKRVYYERRSRQFAGTKAKKENVISLSTQISSFVSMFLNEPQSTHRYFGELLKAYNSRLFLENQSFYPYYVSGLALCAIENLYRENVLNTSLKRFKYHLLLMLRIQIGGIRIPINVVGNRDIEKYCIKIAETLWDREKSKKVFVDIENKLQEALGKTKLLKRQAHSIRAFTEELIPTVTSGRRTGELSFFSSRGFGFIKVGETDDDVFVHLSEIQKAFKGLVKEGLRFSFDTFESNRGPQAKNIELIK